MKKLLAVIAIASLVPLFSGCAICCGTYDYAYPSYGGKWDRGDRFHGRVGSNLSGAGVGYPNQYVDGEVIQGMPYYEGQIIEGTAPPADIQPTPAQPQEIPPGPVTQRSRTNATPVLQRGLPTPANRASHYQEGYGN